MRFYAGRNRRRDAFQVSFPYFLVRGNLLIKAATNYPFCRIRGVFLVIFLLRFKPRPGLLQSGGGGQRLSSRKHRDERLYFEAQGRDAGHSILAGWLINQVGGVWQGSAATGRNVRLKRHTEKCNLHSSGHWLFFFFPTFRPVTPIGLY